MDNYKLLQDLEEHLGVSGWILQLAAMSADVNRLSVDYRFDASRFFVEHVGPFPLKGNIPETPEEVGAIVRAAILATNAFPRGGAAGYLAIIDLLMLAFRADYRNADELVRRYVLADDDTLEDDDE